MSPESDSARSDDDRAEWELSVINDRASALGLKAPIVSRVKSQAGLSGLRWGDEDPEWVFVHGSRLEAHTWDRVALSLGRPAIAIDLPGHGRSERYRDGAYTLARMGEDAAATIRELAVGPVAVLGHSLGGSVSIAAAKDLGDLVKGLVLLDVVPRIAVPATPPRSILHRGTLAELAASATESTDRTILARTETSVRLNARSHDGKTWEWLWDPRILETVARRRSEHRDLLRVTRDLESPALVIRGAESHSLDEATAIRFRDQHPHFDLDTAPGAGHLVHRDNPEWLTERLRSFTRCLDQSDSPLGQHP